MRGMHINVRKIGKPTTHVPNIPTYPAENNDHKKRRSRNKSSSEATARSKASGKKVRWVNVWHMTFQVPGFDLRGRWRSNGGRQKKNHIGRRKMLKIRTHLTMTGRGEGTTHQHQNARLYQSSGMQHAASSLMALALKHGGSQTRSRDH